MTTAPAAETARPGGRSRPERADVLRLVGIPPGVEPPDPVSRLVDRMMERAEHLIEARTAWRRVRVEACRADRVRLEHGGELRSRRLARVLRNAREMVCFVATIGPALEEEVSRLGRQGLWAEAFVLDAVGSAAAEALAEALHRRLAGELARQGRAVTSRFSPGYCDWPVQGQFDLFRLLGPEPAGVRLLGSGFMVPRKSVSAVFGVLAGGAGRAAGPLNPCSECPMQNCAMRRTGVPPPAGARETRLEER